MKKIYLLAFALGSFVFSANAQLINDDMEGYTPGPVHEDHWSSWSGGAGPEDMIIVTDQSFSGGQSGYIGAGAGPQDAMLLLGNKTTGQYTLSWYMYIKGGKTAYYNVQEDEDTGSSGGIWGINVHFNEANGSPGTGTVQDDLNPATTVATFSYPENFWFQLTHEIDVDTDTVKMYIDGSLIYDGAFYSGGNLGGIDFYAIDANNEYYVDDVYYADGIAGVSDFSADSFRVYPNPVKDVLNISTKTAVDNIAVYDVLGKLVLSAQPDVISPKINMSGLSSGAYMVIVTIGNASKTVKIIK